MGVMGMQLQLMGAASWAVVAQRAQDFFAMKYPFIGDMIVASVLVGGVCALVGTFLVLQGLSLLGDAAGHATLLGVCLAFLVVGQVSVVPILVGAGLAALAAALGVNHVMHQPRARADAAIGVVLSICFGGGLVALSWIQHHTTGASAGLTSMLFGNVAGIEPAQVKALAVVAALLTAGVLVGYRPLTLISFDETFAQTLGVPVRAVRAALLAALALAVVVSIQAVGVVLVSAMLIIPPSTALLCARRLPVVLGLSCALGMVCGVVGALVSYLFSGVATGPAMVLCAGFLFTVALAVGPRHGALWVWWRRRKRLQRAKAVQA